MIFVTNWVADGALDAKLPRFCTEFDPNSMGPVLDPKINKSKLFIVSASRSPPGLCSDNVVRVPFLEWTTLEHRLEHLLVSFLYILGSFLGIWGGFGTLFGCLGTILGTLWAHILRSRMVWVARGAPRGTTPHKKLTLLGTVLVSKIVKSRSWRHPKQSL